MRQILGLMGPAVIGNASGQLNILVNTNLAAGLRDAAGHAMNGPVSWLAYAYRFFALPLGIFGVAIASAALPRLSRSAVERNSPSCGHPRLVPIMDDLLLTIRSLGRARHPVAKRHSIVYPHGRFLPSRHSPDGPWR